MGPWAGESDQPLELWDGGMIRIAVRIVSLTDFLGRYSFDVHQ